MGAIRENEEAEKLPPELQAARARRTNQEIAIPSFLTRTPEDIKKQFETFYKANEEFEAIRT